MIARIGSPPALPLQRLIELELRIGRDQRHELPGLVDDPRDPLKRVRTRPKPGPIRCPREPPGPKRSVVAETLARSRDRERLAHPLVRADARNTIGLAALTSVAFGTSTSADVAAVCRYSRNFPAPS
jgi:hypothetical protein